MGVQQGYSNVASDAVHAGSRLRFADAFRTHSFAAFLALIALVAAFRVIALALNGTELFTDEAQYWAWSQSPALGYFSKPPLIAWIIHGATSVCGESETCIRLPAVALHLATAILVYLVGRRVYSAEVGFWAGLGYVLLPAVSLSSGIITTDVPLLTAWALALFAFAGMLTRPTRHGTLLLAVALGIGLNAKYAMAYFILCAAVFFIIATERRVLLRKPHLWLALAGGLALIAPNILWNVANGFVTFSHTAENANWRGVPFHPDKAAEFLLTQFGVFGPILFGALLVILWRAVRRPADVEPADKLMLAFSIPVLTVVVAQAFASRAHANWAAPAYIAATILVTAVMVRRRDWGWMRASFALNGALALLIAVASWQAGAFTLPRIGDPFARTLGNRELAATVKAQLAEAADSGQSIGAILVDDRDLAAAFAYYGRDIAVPVLSWLREPAPQHHFERTYPFTASSPSPVLLVTFHPAPAITARFGSETSLGPRQIPAGRSSRTVHFSTLANFNGR